MRSKSLLVACFILCSISTFSQVKFGIRAGISSSSIKASDVTQGNYTISTLSNTKVGFHGGLFAQISMLGVGLQPELLLSSTGGEVEIKSATTSTISTQKFTKLDIPVLLFKRFGPARIEVGPVASIVLSKPSDVLNVSGTNIQNEYNSATFGYQAGLGLDILKFAFDLKYEGNLSKLGSSVNIGGQSYNFDSRNHQIIFSVGYFF
ncbi:MAG: porin family protein [Bacteroidota bacterium]|nr:porin family protein [Bacteroidota bacterium]